MYNDPGSGLFFLQVALMTFATIAFRLRRGICTVLQRLAARRRAASEL
jgi:hypothetical protein